MSDTVHPSDAKQQSNGASPIMTRSFTLVLVILQIVFLILFAILGRYPHDTSKMHLYGHFQDTHVMIFIGFGVLMTFLRRYGFSSICVNMLLGAVTVQWHTIVYGLFELHHHGGVFEIGLKQLILSEFCAGAILISMGALLGKLSPLQFVAMAVIETVFYTINEYIVFDLLLINDVGGSMNLHMFGAIFGLACSYFFNHADSLDHPKQTSGYRADILSMIGTIFLWMFWPSFNSAIAEPLEAQQRAVVNTYFSLAASCVTVFALSAFVHKHNKFEMDHIQNATLAGGVIAGSSANLMIQPSGAIAVGVIGGAVSLFGFRFLTEWLNKKPRLHDTCGVNNLHGIPGLLGGLISAIVCGAATESVYGKEHLYEVFPAFLAGEDGAPGRTALKQAGFQVLGIALAILFALVGGILTGFLLRFHKIWGIQRAEPSEYFEDALWFHMPDDVEESEVAPAKSAKSKKFGRQDTKFNITAPIKLT